MDWEERNLMIKAAFPAAVRNTQADFEIPFGFVSRPTDGTEVPALKWIDLTDESRTYGLSLLNDSKYGFDVKNNVLRISLVHGATSPDPEADRGEHEVLYSLFPHAGSWGEAMTFRKGYELNNPLMARVGMVHTGPFPPVQSFFRVEPGNIILSTLKKESDYFSRALILRLFETLGKETEAVIEFPYPVTAKEANLIEWPLAKIDSDGKMLRLKMKPFEIRTIRVIPNPGR
jgi:alpha-mannosidase